MFTVIPYLYRDASNYKAFKVIALDDVLSADDIAAIKSKLSDGEFFIPADLAGLKLPELQDTLEDFPSEDDHVWHTLQLEQLEEAAEAPEDAEVVSKTAFMAAFVKIKHPNDWDVSGCMDRLGID